MNRETNKIHKCFRTKLILSLYASHLLSGAFKSTKKLEKFGSRSHESYKNQVYTLEIYNLTKEDVGIYDLRLTYQNKSNNHICLVSQGIVLRLNNGKILII